MNAQDSDTITIDGVTMTIEEYVNLQEEKWVQDESKIITGQEIGAKSSQLALDRRKHVRRGRKGEHPRKKLYGGRYYGDLSLFLERVRRRLDMNVDTSSKSYRYLEGVLKTEGEDWWKTKELCSKLFGEKECIPIGKLAPLSKINNFLVENGILAKRISPEGGRAHVFRLKAVLKDPPNTIAPKLYQEWKDWMKAKTPSTKKGGGEGASEMSVVGNGGATETLVPVRLRLDIDIRVRVSTQQVVGID